MGDQRRINWLRCTQREAPDAGRVQRAPALALGVALCGALVILSSISSLTGCSPAKQAIPVDYTFHVKDPLFQKLVKVTNSLSFHANGTMNPGHYWIHGLPVDIAHDTDFTLELTAPIAGSTDISLKNATGKFVTDQTITVAGVSAPKEIVVVNGTVSADVDFVRLIFQFLLGGLQATMTAKPDHDGGKVNNSQGPGPIARLIKTCRIDNANFQLRKNSSLELPGVSETFAEGSNVVLKDLVFDDRFDYRGECSIDVNLAQATTDDSARQRKSISKDAKVCLALSMAKQDASLHLTLAQSPANEIDVQNGEVTDGSSKWTYDRGILKLRSFDYQRILRSETPPSLSLSGQFSCQHSHTESNKQQATVEFDVPTLSDASVEFSKVSDKTPQYKLTAASVTASPVSVTVHRPQRELALKLKQTTFDQLQFSSTSGLDIQFAQSRSQPISARLFDSHSNQQLKLDFAPGSQVALSNFGGHGEKTSGISSIEELPVDVKSGNIRIEHGDKEFECSDVDGEIIFSLDQNAVSADGKFKLNVLSRKNDLGLENATAHIGELDIHQRDQQTVVDLKKCKIVLTPAQLQDSINEKLPREQTFFINRSVFAGRKWRYRNLLLNSVTITNPRLSHVKVTGKGKVQFDVNADVATTGTVERFQLLPVNGQRWARHPWSAHGKVSGAAIVAMQFVPGNHLDDSSIDYTAQCHFQVPENLEVDWSRVSGDVLADAEQHLLKAVIKNAGYFVAQEGIPLESRGTLQPFKRQHHKGKKQRQQIKVQSFSMDRCPEGVCILIDAQSRF